VQMVEPVFTATHVLAFHNAKFDLKMLVVALPLSVVKLTCIENGRLHRISW